MEPFSPPTQSNGPQALIPPVPRQLASEQALRMLAQGQPLPDVLAELALSLEAQDPSFRVAIFVLSGDPAMANFGAAPSLPGDYAAIMLQVPRGERLPAPLAAACAAGHTLHFDDIHLHPLWRGQRGVTERTGQRGAFVRAIPSFDQSAIGILVVHHGLLSPPRNEPEQLIEITAKLAGVAILRYDVENERTQLRSDLKVERIERDALNLELQQAARAREEFMCIAAHELRTPLAALMLQADSAARLMQREDVRTERLRGKVTAIQKQIDRLKHLVEDLLDHSQVSAGRLKLNLNEIDLLQVTQEAIGRVSDAYARAHCELRLHTSGEVKGSWDALRLAQVVNNLLMNALKYGQGRPVDVTVQGTADSGLLIVSDQGMGIAPTAHRRIFQRFGRAVSETHFGGFGMGLWLSKMVIDALGGTITVESDIGKGANFTVVLPREAQKFAPALQLGAASA